MKKAFILGICALLLMGCGDVGGGDEDGGDDFGPVRNTRGWRWVRNNPMFISALTISMGPPPASFVRSYFSNFQASAAHVWVDGLPRDVDGWLNAGQRGFRYVSWLQPNGTSAANGKLLGGYPANSPGRIGFQIGDEPARGCATLSCAMKNLNQMGNGIRNVRKADPNALIYVNFQMSNFTDALLRHYCKNMDGDIISHDYYTYNDNAYRALAKFRRFGLNYSKPYWRYIRSYRSADNAASMDESDMRWQAFAGLVYGYTGQSWFIYNTGNPKSSTKPIFFDRAASFNARTTGFWNIAAKINREMKHMGRSITQLTSTDVRYVPSTLNYLPPSTTRWKAGAGGDPYLFDVFAEDDRWLELSIGFFKDIRGERYIMVQNAAHSSAHVPLDSAGRGTVRMVFYFGDAPKNVKRSSLLTINKQSGKVVTLPMTKTDGEASYVDISLNAGDAILVKYNTGKPFARR